MAYSKGIAAKISGRNSGQRYSKRHAGTLQVGPNILRHTGTDGKVVYIEVDNFSLLKEALGAISAEQFIDLFTDVTASQPGPRAGEFLRNLNRKILKDAGLSDEEINQYYTQTIVASEAARRAGFVPGKTYLVSFWHDGRPRAWNEDGKIIELEQGEYTNAEQSLRNHKEDTQS